MDEIVRQAMAKWPSVPACYGWLGLDARGQWWMRDERAQAAGAFDSGLPGSKGVLLRHQRLIEFIGRNYGLGAQGHAYFQNGPQRVYVELEATPWVWRIDEDGTVRAHTGALVAQVQGCEVDEQGWVYLITNIGFGLVHSLDVGRAAEQIERGVWAVQEVCRLDLPQRHGYQTSPQRDSPPVVPAR